MTKCLSYFVSWHVSCGSFVQPSIDPWDAARSGMVNIDDITDTKHKPAVEVKPFTDSHRPLADLVREAPAKVRVKIPLSFFFCICACVCVFFFCVCLRDCES